MSIENLFSRHCSFCGDPDHNISVCDSDLIPVIDRKMSEGFYAITQQGALLASREEDIKERFIVWATDMFHYKDLRVFIITTIGSPASGSNKRQYAEEIWNIYKTLTATATATATVTATATATATATVTTTSVEEDEVTWSIDRTPRRHSDVEMMPLPSIRAFRSERVRERRARDVMNYIPSPEFVSFVRNLMEELDTEADFIPFSNEPTKFNIALTLLDAVVADAVVADAVVADAVVADAVVAQNEVCECAICLNSEISSTNIVTLNCEHQFCGDCIIGTLKTYKKTSELKPRCALCRSDVSAIRTNSADVLARIQEFCL